MPGTAAEVFAGAGYRTVSFVAMSKRIVAAWW